MSFQVRLKVSLVTVAGNLYRADLRHVKSPGTQVQLYIYSKDYDRQGSPSSDTPLSIPVCLQSSTGIYNIFYIFTTIA